MARGQGCTKVKQFAHLKRDSVMFIKCAKENGSMEIKYYGQKFDFKV